MVSIDTSLCTLHVNIWFQLIQLKPQSHMPRGRVPRPQIQANNKKTLTHTAFISKSISYILYPVYIYVVIYYSTRVHKTMTASTTAVLISKVRHIGSSDTPLESPE